MSVVDLQAARDRRDGPDAEHVRIVDNVKWFRFAAEFVIDGKTFAFDLWARDFGDAQRRIEAIRFTAVLSGQVYTHIGS